MDDIAIELGTAYVSIVPSAKGLAANLGKELAPASGIAAAQGQVAGRALGGSITSSLGKTLAPGFTSIFKKITTGLASPAGIAALTAGAFIGLVNVGKQFGSVTRIIRQETGATGKTLAGLGDTVKRVFAVAPEGLTEITKAVDELFKRGVPLGAQLDKLAAQELFLSKITGSDLAATVESTTAIFAKFNVPLRDQSRELDVLFKAQQQSGKGFDELSGTLTSAGAILQQFGFNLDESTALVAGLEKAGVNVQPALAGLKKAFGSITQAGGKPKEVLAGLIKELTDGKHPTDAMAKAIKLFGNRSGAELAIAIQKGKLNIQDMLKIITDGRGGIIATGEATLTLAEKFTLFKHRALLDLSEFGAKALDVFKTVVNEGGPILGDLVKSVADLGKQLIPALAPIGIAIALAFKVALPLLSAFAAGLDTVASVLSHIPGPVIAAAGALAALAFGFAAVKLALVTGALTSFLADLNPVSAGLIVAATAITIIGAAVKIFGGHSDAAKKEAKALGESMIDLSTSAGIFKSGITSATEGVEAFLKQQIAAGKADDLKQVLLDTGTSVSELGKHLTTGKDDFKKYEDALTASALASGKFSDSAVFVGFDISNMTKTLEDQRKAFEQNAQATLASVVANGDLKQSDLDGIIARRKNTDGTINYARVLDRVNGVLAEQAFKQDQIASGNIKTSQTYAELANAIATGTIPTEAATAALEQLGFSTEGAKTRLKDLTSQTQSFVTAVTNALPTAAEQVKTFTQQIETSSNTLESDVQAKADIVAQIAFAGGQASDDLKNKLNEATLKIVADLHTLAADQDPQKFTDGLKEQAKKAGEFLGNLRVLVAEGFGQLAGLLAQQGPAAAGALAAGLASNKSKAAAAAGANELLTSTSNAIAQFARGNFAQLNGIGEKGIAAPVISGAANALKADQAVPAAAAGLAVRASDRFRPDFSHRTRIELQAAAVALANDPTVSQAAGNKGIAAVLAFGAAFGPLTLQQAVKIALTAAGGTVDNDHTVQTSVLKLSGKATAAFAPDLKTGVATSIGKVVGTVNADGSIQTSVLNLSPKVAGAFQPDIAGAARHQLTAAVPVIQNVGALTTAAGFAGHSVGVGFDSGMAEGIYERTSEVVNAAISVAQAAVAGAKGVKGFNSNSPSKVGIGIGQDFVDGVAIGLKANAKLTAAGARFAATTTSFSVPESPTVRSHQAVAVVREEEHLHFHGNVYGMPDFERHTIEMLRKRSNRNAFISGVRTA